MENQKPIPINILMGVFLSAVFTAIIGLTAGSLAGFNIIGKTVPFAYPWRLVDPTALSHLTAWGGYLAHNLIAWGIIFVAQRQKPGFNPKLRWFNWAMIATNIAFIGLHGVQSHIWFDGLAQDVPEISALGSVALMLMVILIMETPRRGLIFGKKLKFHQAFLRLVRQYHGYLFSWATIYTFWYHPTEGTIGHLAGFFYMFMLFVQASLLFNRSHLNKWWTVTLEVFVLIHGMLVALFQGNALWPMFAFGFGAMLVLTQMFGLGFKPWTKRLIGGVFVLLTVGVYAAMGRLAHLDEVIRIPVLEYGVVFLLYGLFLAGLGISRLFSRGASQPQKVEPNVK